MVSATASQLSAAATSAAASSGLLQLGSDFDSSASTCQHQLSYDKRLYKECVYVGFYLSLCEERIQSHLGLWSTLVQALADASAAAAAESSSSSTSGAAVTGSTSSSACIEACWRKSLAAVNKSHSLALHTHLPAHRMLAMFKWCERALDLPLDHPLLVLFWQRFFDKYLEKTAAAAINSAFSAHSYAHHHHHQQHRHHNSYNGSFDMELRSSGNNSSAMPSSSSSSNNNAHLSATFKLMTSSNQLNSMLKQMKKQLEMSSQHYAYECTSSSSTTTTETIADTGQPSAPPSFSAYQFNESVSKLYYALSLWVDER